MIAPDLETGIDSLRELIEQAAASSCRSPAPASRPNAAFRISARPAASGPRCGRSSSTISWPARRCATRAGGGASPWRSSSAARSPAAAICALASLYRSRQGAGGDHAEHRQSASGLRHCRRTTWSNCTATRPTRPASTARKRYELPWVQAKFRASRRPRAGLHGLRRLHQDRDGLVRSGDAGGGDAARAGADAGSAISSSRSARRWWCGRRRAFRWRRNATARGSSSSIASRPSSTTSPISCVRDDIGDVLGALHRALIRRARIFTACAQTCAQAHFALCDCRARVLSSI